MDGVQLDFIGAINVHTPSARKSAMIGNYMYRTTPESSGSIVVGFRESLGQNAISVRDVAPLGMMIKGYGNNGEGPDRGRTLQQRVFAHSQRLAAAEESRAVRLHPADRARPPLRQDPSRSYRSMILFELNAHNYMEQRLSK